MSADVLAVLLAGAAGWVVGGHGLPARDRLRRLSPPGVPRPARRSPARLTSRATGSPLPPATLSRKAPAGCAAAVAVLTLTGHGLAAVLVTAVSLVLVLPARRGEAAARRLRADLDRELPRVADLLAACLNAGLAPADALLVVCDHDDGVLAAALSPVVAALRLGVDPVAAWALAGSGAQPSPGSPGSQTVPASARSESETLRRLGRAFVRAAETGAPLALAVAAVAGEQRERARWAAEAAARRAGVRVVGPLAVCFLPAFVLLGVVPFVASVARDVLAGLS